MQEESELVQCSASQIDSQPPEAKTASVDQRVKYKKWYEDIVGDFFHNLNFQFFIDNKNLLSSLCAVESKAALALHILTSRRGYYVSIGQDFSEEVFMRQPDSYRKRYNYLSRELEIFFWKKKEFFVDRAVELLDHEIMNASLFIAEDLLIIMMKHIDNHLRSCMEENYELFEENRRLKGGSVEQASPSDEWLIFIVWLFWMFFYGLWMK